MEKEFPFKKSSRLNKKYEADKEYCGNKSMKYASFNLRDIFAGFVVKGRSTEF